jgi:transcriptional regulator with XRE-family HTH domain
MRDPADMSSPLGGRLKEARKLRRLSQVGLAKLAGLKQPSISELESGETKEISGPTLIAICAAMKIRPEWLVTGKEPMEPGAEVAPGLTFRVDEAQAVKNLRDANPKWRRYVLSLAMITDKQRQELFLDMLGQHVPDEKVAAAYGKPGAKK